MKKKEAKSTLEEMIKNHFNSRYAKVDLKKCQGCDNLDTDSNGYCCMVIGGCVKDKK